MTEENSTKPRQRRLAVIAALVAGVLAVLYGGAYAAAGGSVARGASVAGVDIGGLSVDEAQKKLEEKLPEVVNQPINVKVGDTEQTHEIVPSESGLAIDYQATAEKVPGGDANPISLIKALTGAGETEPVTTVDKKALTATVTEIADRTNKKPVNGSIAFDDGQVAVSEPVTGLTLDVEAGVEAIADAFYGEKDVTIPVKKTDPEVGKEEVKRATEEFAKPAMSASVSVTTGDKSVALSPTLIGKALKISKNKDGKLVPQLDGEKLSEVAHDELSQIGQAARDASVSLDSGAPVVVPAQTGQGIEPKQLEKAVFSALTKKGAERVAEVTLTEVEPEVTTAEAEKLGVKEVVSEFSTTFPHANYRNVNIGTAAKRIDNTLLAPGDEFSLNGIVGERTKANGFTEGTIIDHGRLEESMGGGVSQVATTTFHAAFKAGLEDVEHWPHSIYFDRYPIGQEATVAWGAKDMRFKNDTPYGVVVDTSFSPSSGSSQGRLVVRIWSTQHFKVETSVSERRDPKPPRTIKDSDANCSPVSGSNGFTVTSFRKVWDPSGNLVKDESKPWTYNPNHTVVCTGS